MLQEENLSMTISDWKLPLVHAFDEPLAEFLSSPLKLLVRGSFRKKILLIIDDQNFMDINPAEENILSRLFVPSKLSWADVGLINLAHSPIKSFSNLNLILQPEKVVLFSPAMLPKLNIWLDAQPFSPFTFSHLMFLISENISVIDSAKDKKMLFWKAWTELLK